ncbi:hypothetical protein LX36DRAFT_23869 [Colletotrichum falcatum]|nr:hypothetical protein LX36DRAFT_23869 [Colletotrichum falcatum]
MGFKWACIPGARYLAPIRRCRDRGLSLAGAWKWRMEEAAEAIIPDKPFHHHPSRTRMIPGPEQVVYVGTTVGIKLRSFPFLLSPPSLAFFLFILYPPPPQIVHRAFPAASIRRQANKDKKHGVSSEIELRYRNRVMLFAGTSFPTWHAPAAQHSERREGREGPERRSEWRGGRGEEEGRRGL